MDRAELITLIFRFLYDVSFSTCKEKIFSNFEL